MKVLLVMTLTAVAAFAEIQMADELLIHYVPISLLTTNEPVWTTVAASVPLPPVVPDTVLIAPRDKSTPARWQRFESEYGIRTHSSSWFTSSMRLAKYQVDESVFAVKQFLDHNLKFDIGVRELFGGSTGSNGSAGKGTGAATTRKSSDLPVLGRFGNPRLKSDISLGGEHKSFVGIKLVLPLKD